MGLQLLTIAIFLVAALLYTALLPAKWRTWALFLGSVVAIYWLQPDIRVRFLDFLLPTATLALTGVTWFLTRSDEQRFKREDGVALGLALATVLGLSLLRFVPAEWRLLVASRPPDPMLVLGFILAFAATALIATRLPQRWRLIAVFGVIVAIFVALKLEPLALSLSAGLRDLNNQDVALASALDLNWLGFSYVAFRLLHTVQDRQSGQLPELSLREYVTYVVFFPAYIAGPIDRAEKFQPKLAAVSEMPRFDSARITEGLGRIAVGLLKKFVIADLLAVGLSLTPQLAEQGSGPIVMWVLLYGYALRLFFDFSGYTDIVIGIAILFGIKLPENFKRPYFATSITQFWQSWHITLSDWARYYVFSPLSRNLLRRKPQPSPVLVVLTAQLATMIVIGLWHGITLNFLIWGVWHGLGLFAHKRFTDRTRKWYRGLRDKPTQKRLWDGLFWFVTIHFVVLSWVWFALPEFGQALRVFGILLGGGA